MAESNAPPPDPTTGARSAAWPRPTVPPASGTPLVKRRSRWLGSVVALVGLVALAALAWYLTHRPAQRASAYAGAGSAGPASAASGSAPADAGGAGGGPVGPGGRGGRAGASTVGIAVARQADIPVVLEALGTVTPVLTVTVRPQVSGVLTQVLFSEGQMVNKGQLLATVDPRPFEIALQQASGARLRDEAQLENAKLTLQRYRTLLGQDSIARQDVDTQGALVKQLEGTVTIDRANEATARLNVGYSRIVAPVSGRVGLRPVDAGNVVGTGDANGVALITQLAPIDVAFSVPQDRVPEVQARRAEGARMPVTALDRTRTKKLDEGTFSTLDNEIDTQTGTVKAKARFANPGGALFPNQFVNVQVLLRSVSAVVVPVTSLRHGANGDFVYVLNDDRTVSMRTVTRGDSTVDVVAIASGLEAGERVVTEGADRLKDGARVQLASERPASSASGASGAGGRGRGRRADRGASGAAAAGERDARPVDGGASAPRRHRDEAGTGRAAPAE